MSIRGSIVVSIPACHAGNPGSIPGLGAFFRGLIIIIFMIKKLKKLIDNKIKNLANPSFDLGTFRL